MPTMSRLWNALRRLTPWSRPDPASQREAEWLACSDPEKMLAPLVDQINARRPSSLDRKLSLFQSACCRGVWDLLDETSRRVVEVQERFADGLATSEDVAAVASAWPSMNAGWPVVSRVIL
jgi:hypothetical protein